MSRRQASSHFSAQRNGLLYFIAGVLSLLLSVWIQVRGVIVNPDAVCYLSSAETMASQGFSAGMHLCGQAKWPLYSFLIYIAAKTTGLSYISAAYILNAIFDACSILVFIRIIQVLGANRRIMWLAAGVILFAHQFNGAREYIIRDHGFWTFYLLSILFLLQYFQWPRWKTALCWSASMLIAALFRIEGACFLFVLPFLTGILPGYTFRQRCQFYFQLNLLTGLAGFGVAAWLLFHPSSSMTHLGRLSEIGQQLTHGLILMGERYQASKMALAQHILMFDSVRQAGSVLVLLLAVWYLVSVAANVSWPYAFLTVFAWCKRIVPSALQAKWILGSYVVINLIVTLGFLLEKMFLSKRYLLALSLTLMLYVPFALDYLIKNRRKGFSQGFLFLLTIGIVFSSITGMINFGYSKTYVSDAGNWLAKNVPAEASLYVNDYQLMYYSRHFGQDLFQKAQKYAEPSMMENNQWKKFDYLALRLKHKDEQWAKTLLTIPLTPVKTFSNRQGERVVIYAVRK